VKRLLALILCCACCLFAERGFAQNATTSVRGTVTDPTGAMVPGATVTLVNKATGQTLTATAQSSGEYQLQQIPPAKYTITATASGFGNTTKEVELLVNQPATINFALSLQTQATVVDVSEAAETLNVTDASLGQATSNSTIQALPSETRNIPDLLALQPGVFFIPIPADVNPAMQDSRSGAVNGGRSDQSNVTLDGVDDNDQARGLAFTGILRATQDSTEEFRVTTSNANADEGRSSGAQVSIVTKSGTNKFHGAAYEYFRPSNTVSNDFFLKNAQTQEGLDNRPPKLIRNIFGGDVGGPIFKNKLFFFANYEASRQAESVIQQQEAPTALFQKGVLQYTGSAGATVALTPGQVTALDTANGCTVCNTPSYPYGPGPDPKMLAFLNTFPAANGTALGDGLNTGSYAFASPHPIDLNTSIVKIDWVAGKHRIFGRGNLQKDTTLGPQQFPGQPASYTLEDNSKGMTFGDSWSITSNLVNDIRYGYVRQGYGQKGIGVGDYVDLRLTSSNTPATPTAETRTTIVSVPVNNIIDNMTWSKGKHTVQFGVNWRQLTQNRSSDANSYNNASTNPYWLGGTPPDPSTLGLDTVADGFSNSYGIAYANLVGTVPSVTNLYNYHVDTATSGTLLNDGAFLDRHFKSNEYEGYVQDSWRARANLTLTFGLRYTILQTPWETKGQQVSPTIDTHAWYQQREAAALKGQVYEQDLDFVPSGKYYGKPGFWPKSKDNIAPRFAVAYAPDPKTSIRAGAGMYYDHYGEGLINTFDQNGSFGINSAVTNPAGLYSYDSSPRFTDRHTLPFSNGAAPATITYPYTAPQGNFAITWGLDNRLKTPYSESFDVSVQREIPGGFTLETAYVGRFGRHLLQNLDLAEPVDYVDPQGAGDYYTAGAALSKAVDANGGNTTASVQAIPYFEHLFPWMANFDYQGESATQAIYTNEWAPYRYNLGATTSLADLDFFCSYYYPCPSNYQSKFWQDQFSSLYALATMGMSYYNAAQVTLRHPMKNGFQADISYTYSRSIDMGSDAERASEFGNNIGVANSLSDILNTWKPELNRAVSDFDTTHLLTVDYLYELPFGRGKALAGNASHLVDALIGGWQFSGIMRATSGLPFSVTEPGWTTDWQIEAFGVVTNPQGARLRRHLDSNGYPQFFNDNTGINNGSTSGTPIRLPYPGDAGERNFFRGDGYFDMDNGLAKAWKLGEYGNLKFAWEVYNVTNTVRFDPNSINGQLTSGPTLGIASTLLSQPRRMQFSLRYDF
jgi:Carboxypeptidase regulatory-like domain